MTTKADILRAIRRKCLDCSCHQLSEITKCTVYKCDLHPFRLGKDPEPSGNRGFAKRPMYPSRIEPDDHVSRVGPAFR